MTDTELTVQKFTAYQPMPWELLIDYGHATEAEARAAGWTPSPPCPPVPLLVRLRWRWQAAREHWGRRIGSWIADVDLGEDER